jgi:SAM-dependent methyltransferase
MGGGQQRDWDDLARLDPLWAIASTPGRQYGGWDEHAFMASGRRKAERVLSWLDELGAPVDRRRALDFGCGVGRLTIPLSEAFGEVVGVDIAPGMVEQAWAKAVAVRRRNVRYVLGDGEELRLRVGGRFDLVYTSQVLQHLPSPAQAVDCLRGLAELVAPGGVLIAQVPDRIGLRDRLGIGRRIYAALRAFGVSAETVYRRLHVNPIRMTSVPRADVEAALEDGGLRLAAVVERRSDANHSYTYQAVRSATARSARREWPTAGREARAA